MNESTVIKQSDSSSVVLSLNILVSVATLRRFMYKHAALNCDLGSLQTKSL